MKRWSFASVLLYFLFLTDCYSLRAQVVVNEVMSSNTRTIRDEDGETPDWIELFNAGPEAVDLTGWSLSDDSLETDKWKFPAVTIPAKGFLLIFASDKDRTTPGAPLHTNFRLGAGKDPVLLYNAAGALISVLPGRCIPSDASLGRIPDGSPALFHQSRPTPSGPNDPTSWFTIKEEKDTVLFSHPGGFYPAGFTLSLFVTSPRTRLHYTTDGTLPDETSPVYAAPLPITDQQGQADNYAAISTSPQWTPPGTAVNKATMIRAVAYVDGCPASPVITHTYLVDPQVSQRYQFPIVSLGVDRSDFFGKKKGIYVPGESPDGVPNYNRSGGSWEREVHLEYFTPDGQTMLRQVVGARAHGRGSRANPQKSLRLYADEEYGKNRIDYPFFNHLPVSSFSRLILRSPDADFSNTLFKDELIHTLLQPTGLELQATQPVVAFLNGEYWGIHHLRERQDKYYLASRFGVHPDSVDILGSDLGNEEIIEGDSRHYQAMLQYIRNHDLRQPSHYDYIRSQMDADNFMEYQIAQLYLANFDWPHNNVRYWRPRRTDGKWRWLFFDCDACMIKHSSPDLSKYVDPNAPDDGDRFLLRSLLQNEGFRQQFVGRFFLRLNTIFEPGRVIQTIEQFRNQYAPMVAEHIARWNTPDSYNHWLEALEEMKRFALQRPVEIIRQLQEIFPPPFRLHPNPAGEKVALEGEFSGNVPLQITFLNAKGQPVKFNRLQQEQDWLDVSALPSGLYLVRIQYGQIIFHQKLVITH